MGHTARIAAKTAQTSEEPLAPATDLLLGFALPLTQQRRLESMTRTRTMALGRLGAACATLFVLACSSDRKTSASPSGAPDAGSADAGVFDAGRDDVNHEPDAMARGDGGSRDAGAGTKPSPLDASLGAFCAGSGSVVTIPTASGDACIGDVTDKTFRFAVCSCTTLSWSGTLTTDSFNSATGQSGESASVGANLGASSSSKYDIGGSLWSGAPGLSVTGSGRVSKDVHVGGFDSTAPQSVGGDLFSDGAAGSYITVGGAVHVPSGTMLKDVTAKGGVVNEPVSIAEPCNCKDPVVNPASVVDFVKVKNDNAVGSVDSAALTGFHDPQTLDLPCGRYFFDEISGSATLTFKLTGRTVVAVDGKVALSGAFNFVLAEGAELDLFVRGDLDFSGSNTLGDVARPASIRVYAAGSKVQLSGGTRLGGNIYAPNAEVSSSGNIEVSGSLFGREVSFTGETQVHYDEAILEVEGCDPPTTECNDCEDCHGGAPACIKGECQACKADADCCPPLVCSDGSCVLPGAIL